jgi:hypothetical protein
MRSLALSTISIVSGMIAIILWMIYRHYWQSPFDDYPWSDTIRIGHVLVPAAASGIFAAMALSGRLQFRVLAVLATAGTLMAAGWVISTIIDPSSLEATKLHSGLVSENGQVRKVTFTYKVKTDGGNHTAFAILAVIAFITNSLALPQALASRVGRPANLYIQGGQFLFSVVFLAILALFAAAVGEATDYLEYAKYEKNWTVRGLQDRFFSLSFVLAATAMMLRFYLGRFRQVPVVGFGYTIIGIAGVYFMMLIIHNMYINLDDYAQMLSWGTVLIVYSPVVLVVLVLFYAILILTISFILSGLSNRSKGILKRVIKTGSRLDRALSA